MILIIDNYDSFVYNLSRYSNELGKNFKLYRNDKINLDEIKNINPSHIIISPGPCIPDSAGISNSVIKEFHKSIPILGICLGHQCIGQVFGGKIVKSLQPIHGKTSQIHHNQELIFDSVPNPFKATRYHSLIIDSDTCPESLLITSTTDDGVIMSVQHKTYPTVGLQFHPEAVLTEHGHKLLENFFSMEVAKS